MYHISSKAVVKDIAELGQAVFQLAGKMVALGKTRCGTLLVTSSHCTPASHLNRGTRVEVYPSTSSRNLAHLGAG